jgi:hypothetical protein
MRPQRLAVRKHPDEVVLAAAGRRTSSGVTGAEGLEPPTYGFGDRRSTN